MKINTIKIFLYLAIALLIVSCLFHLLTYIPSLRTSNSFLIFVLGIGIFPTFAAAIKSTKKYTSKSKPKNIWKNALKGTPSRLKKSIWFVVAYVFFNFFFSLLVLNKGGLNPEIVDGKFVLESKGRVVEEITEEQYYNHKAYLFRGMSGHFILFQFISIAMLSSAFTIETEKKNHNKTYK